MQINGEKGAILVYWTRQRCYNLGFRDKGITRHVRRELDSQRRQVPQ